MIKAMELENFKCFGERVQIPLAPITLIYGQNSAGKSSILQSLYLMKQSIALAPVGVPLLLRHENGLVDLGSFHDVIHDHDAKLALCVSLSIEPEKQSDNKCLAEYKFDVAKSRISIAAAKFQKSEKIVSIIRNRKGVLTAHIPAAADSYKLAYTFLSKHRGRISGILNAKRICAALNAVDPGGRKYWKHFLSAVTPTANMANDSQEEHTAAFIRNDWEKVAIPGGYTDEKVTRQTHQAALRSVMHSNEYQDASARIFNQPSNTESFFNSEFTLEQFYQRYGVTAADTGAVSFVSDRMFIQAEKSSGQALLWQSDLALLQAAEYVTPPDQDEYIEFPDGTRVGVQYPHWHVYGDPEFERQGFYWNYEPTEELAAIYSCEKEVSREDILIKDVYNLTVSQLVDVIPIAPIRNPPQRWYLLNGGSPISIGFRGEWLLDILAENRSALDIVNDWLGKLTHYECVIKSLGRTLTNMYALQLVDKGRSKKVAVTVADVGYGISQLLPLVTQSVIAEGKTITIEQPEVHIHPRLQAELGELLAWSAKNQNNQFLVETHSEHLMLRVQKLVRKGDLKPEDVSVLYVSRGEDGSNVQQLRLNEQGEFLDPWPDGFFPERLSEILGD